MIDDPDIFTLAIKQLRAAGRIEGMTKSLLMPHFTIVVNELERAIIAGRSIAVLEAVVAIDNAIANDVILDAAARKVNMPKGKR